jgi:hypothetical protein
MKGEIAVLKHPKAGFDAANEHTENIGSSIL